MASVPLAVSMADDFKVQLTAPTAFVDKLGNPAAAPKAAPVWVSDTPAAATVDQTGLVTGVAPGVANVSASVLLDDGVTTLPLGSVAVTITADAAVGLASGAGIGIGTPVAQ